MDAILSLPVLSVFLIPALSSYSTSLNLVFFYMTWTTLVLSHPPLRVELFGTVIVRLLFYIIPSLLFFLFDLLTPSAALVLKAQGEIGLPAGSRKGKIRMRELKVAGWALFNLAFGFAVQAGIETVRTKMFGLRSALKVSMSLPMPGEIAKDLIRGALTREVSDILLPNTVNLIFFFANANGLIITVIGICSPPFHPSFTRPLRSRLPPDLVSFAPGTIPPHGTL